MVMVCVPAARATGTSPNAAEVRRRQMTTARQLRKLEPLNVSMALPDLRSRLDERAGSICGSASASRGSSILERMHGIAGQVLFVQGSTHGTETMQHAGRFCCVHLPRTLTLLEQRRPQLR